MLLSDLRPGDLDALFLAWPGAAGSPHWRLGGESPSPALLHELTGSVDHQRVIRDHDGQPEGLLQVCEVDRTNAYGYLGFLLPALATGAERLGSPILAFFREGVELLGLRKICVVVDEDAVGPLVNVIPHLDQVGRLREHTRCAAGRYLDRVVFEFVAERDRP
jgi:hypothetical protein